jgi:hypothetical protein
MSSDTGNNSKLFLKPQFRGSGRYNPRDIYDENNVEAEELWMSSSQVDHPLRKQKGTIAQLTATPYQIARNSVPSSLYKSGTSMAGTYGVKSLEDDWANAESDTQTTGVGMLSRFEQANLMRMGHTLPTKYREQLAQDQSLVVGGTPFRTSYAKPSMKTSKFDDGRRNWSDLQSSGIALSNYRQNRSIYGVPTAKEIQQDRFIQAQAQGMERTISKGTMGKIASVVHSIWSGGVAKGAAEVLNSGLFADGMQASGLGPSFLQQQGIDPTELVKIITAIIKALKDSDKQKKPKGEKVL